MAAALWLAVLVALLVGDVRGYVNNEGKAVPLVDSSLCPVGFRRFEGKCWTAAKAKDVKAALKLNLTSSGLSSGLSQEQAAQYCSSLSRPNQTVSLGAPANNAEWALVRRMLLAAGLGNDPFTPQKGTASFTGINNTYGPVNFAPAYEWGVSVEKLAWLGFRRNRAAGTWAAPSGETLVSDCPAGQQSFAGFCYDVCPAGSIRVGPAHGFPMACFVPSFGPPAFPPPGFNKAERRGMTASPWTSGQPDDLRYTTAAMQKVPTAFPITSVGPGLRGGTWDPLYLNPFWHIPQSPLLPPQNRDYVCSASAGL
jgi:hypothetical protein